MGNTNALTNYDYSYTETYIGNIYYCLKQVDFDGQYEYSNIINTNCDLLLNNNVIVYPNPAKSFSKIKIEGSYESYKVFDILGQECELNNLNQGIYFIIIDEKQTIKLIIK